MPSLIKNQRKTFVLAAFFVLVLLLLSSCSGNKGIDVKLTTYKIDMSETTAKAGDITFHVKNEATDMEHEFLLFKTDLDASKLPTDADGNVVEDQLTKLGDQELKAGESQDVKVNLQPGHYVVICNMPGHYKQGMYLNFTVQ